MVKKVSLLIFLVLAILGLTMVFKHGKFDLAKDTLDPSIIFKIRANKWLVMTIGAFAVGFSSWIIQRITRNRIIGSSFFGITSFNILLLVLIYTFMGQSVDTNTLYKVLVPFISIGGSIFISLVIFTVILKGGKKTSKNIVLIGILLNYLFTAVSYFYIKFMDPNEASAIIDIGIGGVNEGYGPVVLCSLIGIQIFSIFWYMLIYKKIQVVNINETLAIQQGISIQINKIAQIIIVGLNAAIAFAMLGSVSFVGLMAANIAFKFFKNNRYSFVWSGLTAIITVTGSYLLINCFFPTYYPIGISTSLTALTYFIYRLIRGGNSG